MEKQQQFLRDQAAALQGNVEGTFYCCCRISGVMLLCAQHGNIMLLATSKKLRKRTRLPWKVLQLPHSLFSAPPTQFAAWDKVWLVTKSPETSRERMLCRTQMVDARRRADAAGGLIPPASQPFFSKVSMCRARRELQMRRTTGAS